jgi:hypothetical protein
MAEDPVDFGQSPIVDTVGALSGSTAEVEAAIDRAADASGRQLFVAYVDEFTNPEAADAWANDTAIGNNMGAEDYLLAVAVDGRAYYLSADANASLSDAELARISQDVIEPKLRDGDWAGAAIAAADAIGGGSAGGGGGGGWGWVIFLVVAAVVVAIIAIVLARRRRKSKAEAGPAGPPQPTIDELRRQAGSALVQADDAVKTSDDELGFAVASVARSMAASTSAVRPPRAPTVSTIGLCPKSTGSSAMAGIAAPSASTAPTMIPRTADERRRDDMHQCPSPAPRAIPSLWGSRRPRPCRARGLAAAPQVPGGQPTDIGTRGDVSSSTMPSAGVEKATAAPRP